MNTNFGGGLTIPISNGIGIDYNSTYAFSFSPQIRYNFRHQIGVVFTPKAFTNFHRGGEIDSKKYELLLSDNQQLAVANDSLEEEIDLLKFTLNSKDNSTILTASNNDLTKKVRELEEDNQRLLEELRSRRFELDSQINAWYGKYEILDSSGNAMSIGTKDFKSGYYIIKDQIADFEEAKEMLNRLPFDGLMHPFILGKDGKYLVMALLSEDKDSAQLKLDTANGGQNIYRMKEI
jgi:hypothetical protein